MAGGRVDNRVQESRPEDRRVAESATPSNLVDLSSLSPEQLMEIAARQQAERDAVERQEQQKQKSTSPAGKLEEKYLRQLPKYEPGSLLKQQTEGGFLHSIFDIEGVPASLVYKFVPVSDMHEWRGLLKPVDPNDVTMHESEVAEGKWYIKSYDVDKSTNMVRYRDTVLLVGSRESYDAKMSDKTEKWNDRFRAAAPEGQFSTSMVSGETGREFQVKGESFSAARLSGSLLSEEGLDNA